MIRSSPAVDVHDINVLPFGVDIEKNPIRPNTAAPGGTFGCQAHNVAGERVLLHFQQGGPNQALALSGSFCEGF
jgi:hypothetical protein